MSSLSQQAAANMEMQVLPLSFGESSSSCLLCGSVPTSRASLYREKQTLEGDTAFDGSHFRLSQDTEIILHPTVIDNYRVIID